MKKLIISLTIFLGFGLSAITQDVAKWSLSDLKTAIASADKPTVFNFWATICKPCIQEIPYFQELVKKYDSAGVQLVLVNLDFRENYPDKIKGFAKKMGFTAPVKFLDETNADLFCPLVDSSWSGSIPSSLFINNKTGYRKFFEDQLSREALEKEIIRMITTPRL
jgi:thiol-disulfide isomerase/thioredoxin